MANTGESLAPNRELNEGQVTATMRKVAVRLLPLLLLSYIANLLDRGNVGFTKLTMQADLGMSDTAYAFGTGMFYFGYLVFEVPSNLILRSTGARLWIARIMVTWGIVSGATMLVTGLWSFLSVRILLGVAEAGFFPGIIYYLTYWFPARERTRAVAGFMAANAVGGILTNPLSGLIMQYLDQAWGLHGWQWVFLLESLPSLILGVCVYFWLTDRPSEAHWLGDDERNWLVERMSQEQKHREQRHGGDLRQAMLSPRVWYLILLYFTVAFCANAGGLYLPELIRNHFPDSSKLQIGLLAAVPSLCGMVGMLLNGSWSDRTRKYRLHVGLPALLGAGGWLLAALTDSAVWGLTGLSLAFMGVMSMLPPFWSLPTSFLSGAAAAGGIALINSVGNIGGLLGPGTVGLIHDATHSHRYGLLALAGMLVLSGALALFAPHDPAPDELLKT
ncbi:MAG: MFS transporter [Deltaproteobacteria bacterium]